MDKKIKIIPKGPYEVPSDVPLVDAIIEIDARGTSEDWKAGKKYSPEGSSYMLCRCGHSKNKPFCDGEHVHVGFEGKEVATHGLDEANTKYYKGPEVDLIDIESLCASMRFCDRGVGVWRATISSDKEGNKELAITEACNCAAGRLIAVDKEGNPIEPKLDQEISPVQDTSAGQRGPLWVKGGIPIEGADGKQYMVRNRVTLCRCGESSNMPFCDTSHMNCPHMKGFDE